MALIRRCRRPAVLGVVLAFPGLLSYLPEFSLAVLMVFTGWKMVAGLYHVAHSGPYAFGLAMFCGFLVYEHGIFEGLIVALVVHSFVSNVPAVWPPVSSMVYVLVVVVSARFMSFAVSNRLPGLAT